MRLLGIAFLVILLWRSGPCLAQIPSPDASGTPRSATGNPATPAETSGTTTPAEKKKPKKVWTNEEMGSLKGTISVVGDAKLTPTDGGKKSTDDSKEKSDDESALTKEARQRQIDEYRKRIQELQAQIDAADARINELKSFKGDNTGASGGVNPTQGYNMVPVEAQVKEQEEKKKNLESQIGDVEVEAHKNGFEAGDLR
jgi:hypothetical protein